jgi:biofilm PGA synthesis lipoprotein PgaB
MKKYLLLLLGLLALTGAAPTPKANEPPAAPSFPIRAAQINELSFDTREELGRFFDNLKSAGVNTVIVRVFQNPGDGFYKLCVPASLTGYYFKTSAAPVVCDVLAVIADEAHKSGLKIFAWANTRYADYGIENRSDLHSRYYDFETKSYKPGRGLCIFQPEVRARLIGIYRDLGRYPIDGVLVQDDLMMKHNEDFSPLAVHMYYKDRGKIASPALFYEGVEKRSGKAAVKSYTDDFQDWQDWKASQLLDLADKLRESVREQNPKIMVGCNYYYETGLKPDKGLAWFSQDVKMAAARNFDFYSLMLYHRQIKDELSTSDDDLLSAVALASDTFISAVPQPLEPLLKLQTKDFRTSSLVPGEELERMIRAIPQRARAGVAFFPVSAGMETELKSLISSWEKNDEKTDHSKPADPSGPARKLQTEKP